MKLKKPKTTQYVNHWVSLHEEETKRVSSPDPRKLPL